MTRDTGQLLGDSSVACEAAERAVVSGGALAGAGSKWCARARAATRLGTKAGRLPGWAGPRPEVFWPGERVVRLVQAAG